MDPRQPASREDPEVYVHYKERCKEAGKFELNIKSTFDLPAYESTTDLISFPLTYTFYDDYFLGRTMASERTEVPSSGVLCFLTGF